MYCFQCGKPIPDGNRFCTNCGTLNDPVPPTVPTAPQITMPAPAPPFIAAGVAAPAIKKKRPLLAAIIGACAIVLVLAVLFASGVFSAGSKGQSGALAGKDTGQGLTLSQPVTVANANIGQSGGIVTVNKENSRISGLTIDVPAGSYTSAVNFSVSEAEVKANGFSKDLVILSPLIKIENGGAYAADMMIIHIPCKVPADYIPLGFYYDEQSKSLESIPVLSMDEGSVTLGLRHFSGAVVGAVSAKAAEESVNFDTGFRPGADDFHMVNNGSAIEPNGHCAGQSLVTMWYYANRKLKGGPSLWNLYDNYGKDAAISFKSPDFQYDDVMATRIASVAQKEATWSSTMRDRFFNASRLSDRSTFLGIVYAMKLHKSPQYLSIQHLGADGKVAGGHAIIAYRAEGSRIYVADPNYPGRTDRYIEFSNGKINPYNSAATTQEAEAGKGTSYTRISLLGLSAMYEHQKMAELWSQLEKRTIGDAYFLDSNAKIFTAVLTKDGEKEEEIINGYEAISDQFEIRKLTSDTPVTYLLFQSDGKGTTSKVVKNDKNVFVAKLTLGDNYIGIYEVKKTGDYLNWNNFKWIKVVLPFPFAGMWEGTLHFDKINLPEPDPAASPAALNDPLEALSAGCDQIPLEIYKQLKALEGTSQNVVMAIAETGTKGKYKVIFGSSDEPPEDPLTANDSLDLTRSGSTAKGEVKQGEGAMTLILEQDGNTLDALKGSFKIASLKDPTQGIFVSIKMTRIKE